MLTDEEVIRNIAANVRRLRGIRSLSWLARQIGIDPSSIMRFERGERNPRAATLARLAIALDTTTDALISQPPKKSGPAS